MHALRLRILGCSLNGMSSPNSYAALDDCRFRGNGTDVYNPGGYRIEVNNGTEVALPAGRDAAA